ncbi:MAG: hypothetical protein IT167_16935 [Bryobacterales bacterium]|nr:hypothetical protein [Bryobacterales bacterium]
MIDLVANFDKRGYGIRAALQADRIPYRRIRWAKETASTLLLVAGDEISEEIAALAWVTPALVVGSLPAGLVPLFRDCGSETIVRNGKCWWCRLPLGEAFTELLCEGPEPAAGQLMAVRNISEIDSGWALIELLKTLIRQAAGGLVRLERWPAPYQTANGDGVRFFPPFHPPVAEGHGEYRAADSLVVPRAEARSAAEWRDGPAWLTTAEAVAGWWRKRELVYLAPCPEGWLVENHGIAPISGLCFAAENAQGDVVHSETLNTIDGCESLLIQNKSFLSFTGVTKYATSV